MRDVQVSAIDLFCGAGGLSCGLNQAGVNVLAGIDIDPSCKWPFEHNIGADFIEKSVSEVEGDELMAIWRRQPGLRLLAGCAPCQPFSSQRRGADTSSEKNWNLLGEFGRLVSETLPEFITMENVVPLKSSPVFHRFVGTLAAAGYHVDFKVLKGTQCGLPQTRRRLVLVASRLGRVTVPSRSVAPGEVATVRQTIEGLPPLRAGESDPNDPMHAARALTEINLARKAASRPGGTWRDWPEELRAPCHRRATGRSFQSFYGVMEWDEPSPTITTEFFNYGSGRFGHPDQPRTLTPREAAMLQGFPRSYEFLAPGCQMRFTTVGKLIGNAVPPPFGRVVGEALLEAADSRAAVGDGDQTSGA